MGPKEAYLASSRGIRPYRFEVIALSVAALILCYQLLFPPIVGLADNGDFSRIMEWGGLQYQSERYEDRYFFHINRLFDVKPETSKWSYFTSEVIFAKMAFSLNKVISKIGHFDLRVLGFVHILFYLLSLFWVLRTSKRIGIPLLPVLSVFFLFIFCDVGYVAYLNSFYSEPASMIFFFFMFGFALRIALQREPRFWSLVGFFLSILLFMSAKSQNSILGFLLALFLFRLSFAWPERWWKRMTIFVSVLCCLFSLFFYRSTPKHINEIVLYNSVFYDILGVSPAPERDLEELGLKKEFIRYKKTHAFQPGIPLEETSFREEFFSHIDYFKIFGFYLTHRDRLRYVLKMGAGNAPSLRPDYLGNFEKSEGVSPRSKSLAFAGWSDLRAVYFPKSFWVLGGLFGAAIGMLAAVCLKVRATSIRLVLEWYLLLLFMAVAQFFISAIVGSGFDIVKHLFLFNVIVDVTIVSLIMLGCYSMKRAYQEKFLILASIPEIWKPRTLSFILVGGGAILFIIALLADQLGIGGYPGLGVKQVSGLALGVILFTSGFLVRRHFRKISKEEDEK